MAKGQSVVTGQTVEQATADLAARRAKTEAGMSQSRARPPRVGLRSHEGAAVAGRRVRPHPGEDRRVSAHVGGRSPGAGRHGSGPVERRPGDGCGLARHGGAGPDDQSLARQAPAMAAAGAASQGAVDATGSPLAGLAAGVVDPAAGEAVGAGVRGAAKLVAPVAGGSSLLNATPVVGPALQAGGKPRWRARSSGQSSDPAALGPGRRARPMPPRCRTRPRTLAGSVGNDAGLYQAEKDARNVNNARPTAQRHGGRADLRRAVLQRHRPGAVRRSGGGAAGSGQQGADVFRPGQMISARMDAIDAAAQSAEDRLNAAHADAVSGINAAGQSFAADQQAGLAQRIADRVSRPGPTSPTRRARASSTARPTGSRARRTSQARRRRPATTPMRRSSRASPTPATGSSGPHRAPRRRSASR